TLDERTLERRGPFARDPGLLQQDLGAVAPARAIRGVGEACGQRRRRLAAELQALGGASQPVERRGRLLPLARRVRQLLLGRASPHEQLLEGPVDARPLEPRGILTTAGSRDRLL